MYRLFVWQGYATGGAARITRDIAEYAASRGMSVTVGMFVKDPSWSMPQIKIPVPAIIPSSFRSLTASLVFRLRYAGSFDGVYTHTLGAWRAPRMQLFVHDAADLDEKMRQLGSVPAKAAYALWRLLYWHLCLTKATLIFSGTASFLQYLQRHNIPKHRIVESGSWYDGRIFKYMRRPRPVRPYALVFVGDYTDPAKEFQGLLQAVADDTRYVLHVAGGRARPSTGNIIYHGYLSPPALASVLAKADIFVLPSRSEGFSIALLEALATGIPCLASPPSVPSELAGVSNIRQLDSLSCLHEHIRHIVKHYGTYSRQAPVVRQFSQNAILGREWAALHQCIADRP